jgi:glutamine synthetase
MSVPDPQDLLGMVRQAMEDAGKSVRQGLAPDPRGRFRAAGRDPVPGGRPGEVEAAETVAHDLQRRGVHGVVCSWVDTAGIHRIKTVPARRLPAAVAWGVGMSPVFDTFLSDDSIVATDVLGSPDGDLRLYPDLDRLTALAAQPGWAWAPVDRLTQEGAPHVACTRTLLRRQVAAAAERGLQVRAAVEVEFALGRGDAPEGEFVPACLGPAYGMTRLVELGAFAADLLAAMAAQDVDVDQVHPEYAAGQFEISVGALDPVGAADRSVLVRETVRALAQKHGLRVSFAPSVVAGSVGNGGHLHLSAWRDGRNLHSGGDGRHGMTADAEAFAAGILAELAALAAVATPSPASYLRLVPSHWAGAYACWGRETRESALRVVTGTVGQRDRAANLEVKSIDLAANPYLLLAALIAAGLAGLERGTPLPEEITGDPSRFDEAELERRGIRRLPQSLGEATDAFAASSVLRAALGPVLADAVVAVRRGEAARVADLDPAGVAAAYRWVY